MEGFAPGGKSGAGQTRTSPRMLPRSRTSSAPTIHLAVPLSWGEPRQTGYFASPAFTGFAIFQVLCGAGYA
jgi:hypothetical protein